MPDALLPAHFSSFDDAPLPTSFSSFDEDTARGLDDASVGTGISGLPTAPATWSDVGNQLVASAHDVGATAAGFTASVAGDPTTEARLNQTVQEQQRAADEARAAMTPTVQPGFSHPLVWAAEQAPGALAVAGPAALAGPFAPVVLSGVMAAQTRGDIYNRLKAQGIEPTSDQLTGATALGAATGLAMDLTGGLAGKLPVSKLVGAALGIGAEGGVFGASSGAQEYTSQQAEIAAGKRDNLDPGAILSQTLTGLETGAGWGALGVGRHGEGDGGAAVQGKTRLPKGGESAEPTRSGVNYRKPEAQVTAPVDINTPAENKGPPPAAPKVDPDQAAALGAEPGTISVTKPATEVTPRVTEPPTEPVQQPTVAQPEPSPSQIATEAPRTGDTTEPPPSPQPLPESQPAPSVAPPREDAGAIAREPDAALAEQHAALTDKANPREAMVYPLGAQPIDLPNKSRYGQQTLADGRVIQYDRSGASKLTKAKVEYADQNNRLNEILQLGPVSKDEAVARVAAGEPGAVVTERTPAGTEAKAAAGTTATAPAQAEALEAAKTPGNVVNVERPEDVAAARQAEVAQEQAVQPQVVRPPEQVTQRVTPGRVLEATDVENIRARDAAAAQDALQAQTVAEQLRQKETAKQAAAAGVKERSHAGKGAQAKIANDNIAADKIAQAHPFEQLRHDWPNQVYSRAKAMVDAAKQAGVKIPEAFPEGHPYHDSMLKLREASDLVSKKTPTNEEYGRFIDRENLIDNGKGAEAFAARRNEGALGLGSPEGAAEGVKVAPRGGAADEEGHAEAREGAAQEERPEALTTGHEEVAAEPARERTPVVREAKEGEHYSAGKAATGFKQEVRKNRSIKRQELEDEPHNVMATDTEGNPVGVEAQRSTTAEDAINEHFDPKRYAPEMRPMMERLKDAVMRIASDTPVHYISHEDMLRLGESAHGLYDPDANHILLNADRTLHGTALHEVFHAATTKALAADPELQNLMSRLHGELRDNLTSLGTIDRTKLQGVSNALRDPEEMLTELMTNENVQNLFKNSKISPELARDIGIPKWRKATMWEGALNIMRRALGLGPRDVSAVEAAMAVSEKAMWKRDPGMAMEAGARSLGLRFQREEREAPPERDQAAFLKTPSEHLAGIKNIDKDMVKGYAKDMASNTKVVLTKTAKFLSGTQLRDLHGKLFDDAKGNILDAINHARNKVVSTFNDLRTGDKDLVHRGYILDRKYASEMGNYAELLNLSSRFNIHADREAPKVPKNPVDAPRKNWQGNAQGDRAREIYNALPEELQQRYRQEKQYYRGKQQELAKTVLDKTLPVLDLPKDMEERVRNNDLTDNDWEELEKKHAADAIRNAQRLINKKDVYFPGGRGDGRFVVTGRYEMPKGGSDTDYSGGKLADNKREFNTEQEAHDYVTGTHMPASVRETTYWTDPTTGKVERKSPDEAASSGTISKKYEVSLERQHTEMHDSYSDATKARAEMEKAGVGELSGVLDKRNERAWSSLGSGEQRALERRIMNRDSLTSAEKQHLIESTRTLSLGSQSGMSPHLLQSRKVAGAKFDNGEGLDAYSRAINQHIARNAHSAELSDAMLRLDNHENSNRNDVDATTRSIVANTMRDRVYDPNTAGANSKVSPLLHKLMTMSFINFLVRPSHIFLSQVHPYVYSVPMMAGRHGYWKAINAQKQAMTDLGGQLGNLGRGAKAGYEMFKSAREKDTEKAVRMAHGDDPIHDMIARLTDKDERDAMMKAYETQHLHSAYDQSMFLGGGMDRTNAVMQQFTNSMEANNRLSTMLAAYRLEKAATGDHANALQYGRRVIEETHGLYSAGNTAPIFKNPLMRATLQFHQQPMNLAFMLYRNAFKAFKGDTEARWTLGYQLGTAALLGGMGGMPMDLPKLVGLATQPVTGMAPSDWDDKMRRELADTLGPTATNAIMEGLPGLMGPLGPSLGHRMGFDAGLLDGEPKSASGGDVMAWAAKEVAGAPFGMMSDWLDALAAAEKGDYQGMAEKALPGSLKDFAKAYREGTTGEVKGGKTIRPASFGDALLQTLGFSGVERERQMEGHYKLQEAIKNQPKTVAEQLKAKHAAQRQGKSVLGVPVSKKNAALATEYGSAYQ